MENIVTKEGIIEMIIFCHARAEEAATENLPVDVERFNKLVKILSSMLELVGY